jgi:adenine phosphoribosyltransferase
VRKPGKLPSLTRRASYSLEYGSDSLEIHEDAAAGGQRVLIVDDLLATGGTAAATVGLVRGLGAEIVGVQFLIELVGLDGRSKLKGENINAVLQVLGSRVFRPAPPGAEWGAGPHERRRKGGAAGRSPPA